MERIINFIRGNVRVRVKCKYPERFLNICAESGVEFWDMERDGDELVFTTHYEDYRYLRNREHYYKIVSVKKTGTSFFLWRMRKRYALLAGMVICLVLSWLSSLFIWEITVSGNETVSTAEILNQLEEIGVGIGSNRLTFNQDYISNEMLLRVPELCWITVNTHGSRADVKVREEIPAPEMVDEDVPTLVFAKKAGIIEKMVVWEGAKTVAVGETVSAGDTLVTGAMESLSSGTRYVHAMGDVYARTWYTKTFQVMENVAIKEYTGREKTKYGLKLGDKRINLYFSGNVDMEKYDKTFIEQKLTLFGIVLPVGIISETYSEYQMNTTRFAEVEDFLKASLIDSLEDEIDDGEIVWNEFDADGGNGVVTVTMKAECLEQIGVMREMTEDEMVENSDNDRNI